MDIKIIVATHKVYKMPLEKIYIPLLVGSATKGDMDASLERYSRDDAGENISTKNANYCELTGLYWAWKNLRADYVGIAHYRRHFAKYAFGTKWNRIVDEKCLNKLLHKYDVVLPKKRNYYIETTYTQYIHAHNKQDLDETERILQEYYPEYMEAYENCMGSTKGHKFNMLIMRKEILDKYCEWLFDVLFRLEERLDISEYSLKDQRVFGYVSERLLDVWLTTNKIPYVELPVVHMEKQYWARKILNFLLRKIRGTKLGARTDEKSVGNCRDLQPVGIAETMFGKVNSTKM